MFPISTCCQERKPFPPIYVTNNWRFRQVLSTCDEDILWQERLGGPLIRTIEGLFCTKQAVVDTIKHAVHAAGGLAKSTSASGLYQVTSSESLAHEPSLLGNWTPSRPNFLESSQVVAVLDLEDSSMEKGHIIMTRAICGAFHCLKGKGECEEDKADGEKNQKKPKQGKGTRFKAASPTTRQCFDIPDKAPESRWSFGSDGNLVVCQGQTDVHRMHGGGESQEKTRKKKILLQNSFYKGTRVGDCCTSVRGDTANISKPCVYRIVWGVLDVCFALLWTVPSS